MQFKLTAFYALGILEIFKVDDPHKISCSNEVHLISFLQTVLDVNGKLSTVCLIFGRSNK